MPRQRHRGEGFIMPTKIRKRGCSTSSSSSSRIHHYRLNKRAIVVGKSRAGLGIGSRSSTPVPTWRTTIGSGIRIGIDSPKYSQSGKSIQPVSARRLAATLWEMNEIPSPKMSESNLEKQKQKKMQSQWGLHLSSGSLPPQLSDPSYSPTVSEKMDRTGLDSRQRTPSISQRLRSAEINAAVLDSVRKANFMEIETRSRPPTSGSVSGGRNRLKDVSNALTTSKELLKIINRIWGHADQPSSSMSVISALHAELERARLQVNQLMQEQHSDKNEINYLMKCFAEEKISWKNKERQAIEAAIGSIAGELEVERKLRRRLESLNKKLGKELAEVKSSFVKAVKEVESEKRAREITEQVCDELSRNVDEDRARIERLKSEPVKVVHQSDAKHQLERNSAMGKLRKQLEVFLRTKRDHKDDERSTCLSKSNITSHQNERQDERAVEDDVIDSKEGSVGENDHYSIELNMNNNTNKIHKWAYPSGAGAGYDPRKLPVDKIKDRNSTSSQGSYKSTSIQRTVSDGVERGTLDRQRFRELEGEAQRRSYVEETQRYKPVKGILQDHVFLSSPRLLSSRDPCGTRRSKC